MADHTISLNATEEAIYQKYISSTATTDAAVMGRLKAILSDQVVKVINDAGYAKFNGLSVAQKIAFIEG